MKKLASNPTPLAGCIICLILLVGSYIGVETAYYRSKRHIGNPEFALGSR